MILCFKILNPRLVNKVRDRFPARTISPVTFCAENMYPIVMISSSPTSLITMHNVRRFLQESMHVLFTVLLLTGTDLTKYPLIDLSLQQRHVLVLLQRVRLEQRTSYLSIANVQRLSQVVKHAQVRNDIMSSII